MYALKFSQTSIYDQDSTYGRFDSEIKALIRAQASGKTPTKEQLLDLRYRMTPDERKRYFIPLKTAAAMHGIPYTTIYTWTSVGRANGWSLPYTQIGKRLHVLIPLLHFAIRQLLQ